MIYKVIAIQQADHADDSVELAWFDMQKPNLSALTCKGVEFIVKVKYTHLHEGDVLVCEDGYSIKIHKSEDTLYTFEFDDALTFAKTAYEVGNRHQPVAIEPLKITILEDISTADIVKACEASQHVIVTKHKGMFSPNGHAHHSH